MNDDDELRAAVDEVLRRFEEDERAGYRSRDRQFAIEILRKGLGLMPFEVENK